MEVGVGALLTELNEKGYLLVEDLDEQELLSFARSFGAIQHDPRLGTPMRVLQPLHTSVAPLNSLSSRYGVGAFPLHTECAYLRSPPKYLLLYCREPGLGRPTLLLDSLPLREYALARKRIPTWIVKSGRPPFYTDVFSVDSLSRVRLRYDRECMFARGKAADAESNVIEDFIASSRALEIRAKQRRCMIIDNERFLHGRGSSTALDPSRTVIRILLRNTHAVE